MINIRNNSLSFFSEKVKLFFSHMSSPSILSVHNGDLDNNYSQVNRFEMVFTVLPNVTYTLNEVNLPGLMINNPQVSTLFNTTWRGADSATFDQLTINFIVQENMANYFEIHDWMRAISFPDSFDDRQELARFQGVDSYGFLTMNNSYNRPIYRFHFYNLIPNSLTGLNLMAADANELFATASFNYTIYKREIVPSHDYV